MTANNAYSGGENFDLRTVLLRGRCLRLTERTEYMDSFLKGLAERRELHTMRRVVSAADRVVKVVDPVTGETKDMIMFGSNNYLGLANHPYVVERVRSAISRYGAGIGGPPLLNGYTHLHRELEERLAAFKGAEDAMIFSSGYGANVGLVTGMVNPNDLIVYDAYSHASFCDGIRMSGVESHRFPHNDTASLERILRNCSDREGRDVFVGVEGVYSMDGDTAPLDVVLPLCRRYGALLVVDDAHGTGVLGRTGRGTAEHYGLEGRVDLTVGTFSKVFAVTGGFVAASKPIIDYLRYFARPYMFSASPAPSVVASVLAGLDVIDDEPGRIGRLIDNTSYALARLRESGIPAETESAIIPLIAPRGMNMRRAARRFHELGIFVNSIEYPAVPLSQQRFRVSMMATHTREDIHALVEAVTIVWDEFHPEKGTPVEKERPMA